MGGIISGIGGFFNNVGGQIGNAAANVGDFAAHELNPFISAADRNAYENRVLAPNADKIGQLLQPVNSFLTHDGIGQAIAPVLAGGLHTGSDGTGLGMGPQYAADIKNTMGPTQVGSVSEEEEKFANSSGFTNTPDMFGSQVNAAADAYKNQAGPPSVHMFSRGQIDPGTGLQYSGDTTGWVSQQQFAQMNNTPAPTTPPSVMEQQIAAGNSRPGDHRTNPQSGVPQTFGIDGVWRDGNSASPPNAVSLPTSPALGGGTIPTQGVNTNTTNPMMSPENWQQQYDKIWSDYRAFQTTPQQKQDLLDKLGPKPGAPGTPGSGTPPLVTTAAQNPVGIGQPGGPSGPPAPGATGTNPAGGAAADAGILAALKGMGIDPNTALLIAGAGGGALTSYLAAHEQSQAATAAAAAQAKGYGDALNQQQAQFNKTNEINAGIYKDQQANIKPWLDGGTKALRELETFDTYNPFPTTQQFDYNNWKDPGYQFRLDKGMDALQNSAAAKGGLLSGNTLKGITDYGQDAASQEYNDAFQRFTTKSTNDFNQGMAQRGMKLGELQSLAGIGQTATQQVNAAGSNYAGNAQQNGQANSAAQGSIYTGSGNAAAAGITGAAGANASGMVGMGNAFIGGLQQYYNNQNSQGFLNALMARNK